MSAFEETDQEQEQQQSSATRLAIERTEKTSRLTITEGIEDQILRETFRKLERKLPKSPGKLMIYFHGNAEDVGTTLYLMSAFRELLGVRVLAMEYRGYGLFGGAAKSSQAVLEDALAVFDFCVNVLLVKPHDIFMIGRSIGCSLAAHVARYRKPAFIILISPFKTLQEAAAAVVGWLLSTLVAQRFDNVECLKHVKAPVMIIHGQKDELIPCTHAQELADACVNSRHRYLLMPPNMSHNHFDLETDFFIPL